MLFSVWKTNITDRKLAVGIPSDNHLSAIRKPSTAAAMCRDSEIPPTSYRRTKCPKIGETSVASGSDFPYNFCYKM